MKKFTYLFSTGDFGTVGKMLNEDILTPVENFLVNAGKWATGIYNFGIDYEKHPPDFNKKPDLIEGEQKQNAIEEVFEDNNNLLGGGRKGSKKRKQKRKRTRRKKSKKGKTINYNKLIHLHENIMYNFRQLLKLYLKYEEFKFKLKDTKLIKKLDDVDNIFNKIFDLYDKINFNSSNNIQDYLQLLQLVPMDNLLDTKSTKEAISLINNEYLKKYYEAVQKSHKSLKKETVKKTSKKSSSSRLSILPRKLSKKHSF